jgi:hypothetical protein
VLRDRDLVEGGTSRVFGSLWQEAFAPELSFKARVNITLQVGPSVECKFVYDANDELAIQFDRFLVK